MNIFAESLKQMAKSRPFIQPRVKLGRSTIRDVVG